MPLHSKRAREMSGGFKGSRLTPPPLMAAPNPTVRDWHDRRLQIIFLFIIVSCGMCFVLWPVSQLLQQGC